MDFKEKEVKDQGNCLSREYIRKDIKREKLIDKLTRRKWNNYRFFLSNAQTLDGKRAGK